MLFELSQEVEPLFGFLHFIVSDEVTFQVIADVYAKKLEGVSYCNWLAFDEERCF